MVVKRDWSGVTKGELTVLYEHPDKHISASGKTKNVQWVCRCTCGNEKIVRAVDLTRRKSEKCLCNDNLPIVEGEKIGKITVIRKTNEKLSKENLWECACECGEKLYRRGSDLRRPRLEGSQISCQRCKRKTHGDSNSPEFVVWSGIIQRCYNPNQTGYEYYGGRGIKMCDRWRHSYANFLEDMGRKPHSNYSIERINVDGDYAPDNCVWASLVTQARNKRVRFDSKSGVTGVNWCNTTNKWLAKITVDGKRIHLGSFQFDELEEATEARRRAEEKYWEK